MNNPKVSVIIIHYNRLACLRETLQSFAKGNSFKNIEYIVADDNSKHETKNELLNLDIDILVTNFKNKGLGNNTNNALKLCRGEYILQLQDDWRFVGDKNCLEKSINLLEKRKDIEMVRFYNSKLYPSSLIENDFLLLEEDKLTDQHKKILYSDTPHLKRNDFHDTYGFYQEGVPMTTMEVNFAEKYSSYRHSGIAFSEYDQFIHTGAKQSFNPARNRMRIYKAISKYRISNIILNFYKSFKK